jgi:hypothetical protein
LVLSSLSSQYTISKYVEENNHKRSCKKIIWGVLLGRSGRVAPAWRWGSALQIFSEMGSDFGVKSHHFGTETEIVALWGDFFACGA